MLRGKTAGRNLRGSCHLLQGQALPPPLTATSHAFVKADPGPALHVGIEQPFDTEEHPVHPSDFAQGS